MKKLFVFLIAVSLFAQAHPRSAVSASEIEVDTSSIAEFGTDTNGVITEAEKIGFDETITTGSLDVSGFFDAASGMDVAAFGQLKYEVPTSVESAAFLNLQYDSLQKKFEALGHGTFGELKALEFKPGYSENIVDMFESTYGDFFGPGLDAPSLPEGWTMSEIMAGSSNLREQTFEGFKESPAFQTILADISTSDVFKQAQNSLTMPTLTILEAPDMQSVSLSGSASASGGAGDSNWIQSAASSDQSQVNTDVQTEFEEAVAKQDSAVLGQLNENINAGVTDQMLDGLDSAISEKKQENEERYQDISENNNIDDTLEQAADGAFDFLDGFFNSGSMIAGEWVPNY